MKKWTAFVLVFVLMVGLNAGIIVKAASINGNQGDLTVTSDGTYIYISYEGDWKNHVGERIDVTDNSGAYLNELSQIVVNQGNESEGSSFEVYNSWYNAIPGASGSVKNSGKLSDYGYETMKWSLKVPVSVYSDYDTSKMKFTWDGKSVSIPVKESSEEPTTEEPKTEEPDKPLPEEPSTEKPGEDKPSTEDPGTNPDVPGNPGGDVNPTGKIVIDGMYGDWTNIPKTEITYSSNNTYCNHYGQLYNDGEYLYGHFKANDLYTGQMQIHLWYITINGQQYTMQIQPEKDGNIDWGAGGVPNTAGTHTNLKVFIGYGNNNECDSQVAYTIYDASHKEGSPGDEVEFSLSLKRLAELTGIKEDQMKTISVRNPNLGGESVTIAGSSTGPWILVTVAFLFVAASVYIASRKKRKTA